MDIQDSRRHFPPPSTLHFPFLCLCLLPLTSYIPIFLHYPFSLYSSSTSYTIFFSFALHRLLSFPHSSFTLLSYYLLPLFLPQFTLLTPTRHERFTYVLGSIVSSARIVIFCTLTQEQTKRLIVCLLYLFFFPSFTWTSCEKARTAWVS